MTNKTPLRPLQASDHFDKKLVKAIDKLNAELAACDADEASAEREIAGLLDRALCGEIAPEAAAARHAELVGQLHFCRTSGSAWDVERLRIAEAREALRPMFAGAHRAEALKCSQAAEERASFMRQQLGPAMQDKAVEAAIRADGSWQALMRESQRWSALAGTSVNSQEDGVAIEEARRRLVPAGGTVPGAVRSPFKAR